MLNVNIEVESAQAHLQKRSGKKEKQSLKQYLLEKMRTWIDSVLEAERDEFLGRGRYAPLGEGQDTIANGYRRRQDQFFWIGKDRVERAARSQGSSKSARLPERKGQDPETEAFSSGSISSWVVDPRFSQDIGETLGPEVRFEVGLSDRGASHHRVRGLAATTLNGETLQVSLYRMRGQLSGADQWVGQSPEFLCGVGDQ